jgi:peptidoglycan/xylan/chitin deacetylase (PgdA/CDA1 family)
MVIRQQINMSRLKILSIALIISVALSLTLTGCNTTGKFAPKNKAQPENAQEKQAKSDQEAIAQSQQAMAKKTNNHSVPVVAIPQAQAGESTSQKVYKQSKYVYLTFDDGPNTDFTGRILDILDQQKVKASFMVVGINAEKNPELIKRMSDEGHAVINHTYTHDYKTIYASPRDMLADLDKASQALEKILGHPVKLFRPPGGPANLTKDFYECLKEKGYQSIGWNITGSDSNPKGIKPEQVYDSVAAGLAKVEQMHLTPIILLHDGTQLGTAHTPPPDSALGRYIQNRESVVAALPKIIELLKSKGYTFAVVDENTPQPW